MTAADREAWADAAERHAIAAIEGLERQHRECACGDRCGCAGRTRTARQALRALRRAAEEEGQHAEQ